MGMRRRMMAMIFRFSMQNQPTITRYPTGCLALEYGGSKFFHWCFDLGEMLAKTDLLGIDRESIHWQERYYDGDYRDPKNYKLRAWSPEMVTK